MDTLFESLESRTLFSTTPTAVGVLLSAGLTVNADGKAALQVDAQGIKTIAADLKSAKLTKGDAAAFSHLKKVDAAGAKTLEKANAGLDKFVKGALKKLAKDETVATKKPNNTKAATALATLDSTFSADAASELTLLTTDANNLQAADDANSTAIATANPTQTQLNADISSYQAGLGTAFSTLNGDLMTGLTTDVAAVVAIY